MNPLTSNSFLWHCLKQSKHGNPLMSCPRQKKILFKTNTFSVTVKRTRNQCNTEKTLFQWILRLEVGTYP